MASKADLWAKLREERDQIENWKAVAHASYYIALHGARTGDDLADAVDKLTSQFTVDQLAAFISAGVTALKDKADNPLTDLVQNNRHQKTDE